MTMIEVYHFPGRGASIDVLLAEGLKSREQLIKEGKLESFNSDWLFNDHLSTIYFQWFPPHLASNRKDNDWISIEVESSTTNVFNREFRYHRDNKNYNSSRMILADYISQHEKTKEMRENLELGKIIVWNPLITEPTIVRINDKRVIDFTWQYLNEILIHKSIIPPSEFKRYHKKIKLKPKTNKIK